MPQTMNIMMQLKTHTTDNHKQLEKSRFFKRLFASDYSVAEYANLIAYFYSYFNAIEKQIFADLPIEYHSYLEYRHKTPLLYQDLIALGVNTQELTRCEILPVLPTFAKKMGAFYVLEGSLLGGRVIARHLKNQLGTTIENALNFYSCYGEDLNTQWQTFGLFMGECFDNSPNEISNEIIAAANATFNSLQCWLETDAITIR